METPFSPVKIVKEDGQDHQTGRRQTPGDDAPGNLMFQIGQSAGDQDGRKEDGEDSSRGLDDIPVHRAQDGKAEIQKDNGDDPESGVWQAVQERTAGADAAVENQE